MTKNYYIIRLYMLIVSPIFPSLLSFIIFTVYKIICDPLSMCDNDSSPLLLDQLKQNLMEEIKKSSTITSNIIEFRDIVEEERGSYALNQAQRTYNSGKYLS